MFRYRPRMTAVTAPVSILLKIQFPCSSAQTTSNSRNDGIRWQNIRHSIGADDAPMLGALGERWNGPRHISRTRNAVIQSTKATFRLLGTDPTNDPLEINMLGYPSQSSHLRLRKTQASPFTVLALSATYLWINRLTVPGSLLR